MDTARPDTTLRRLLPQDMDLLELDEEVDYEEDLPDRSPPPTMEQAAARHEAEGEAEKRRSRQPISWQAWKRPEERGDRSGHLDPRWRSRSRERSRERMCPRRHPDAHPRSPPRRRSPPFGFEDPRRFLLPGIRRAQSGDPGFADHIGRRYVYDYPHDMPRAFRRPISPPPRHLPRLPPPEYIRRVPRQVVDDLPRADERIRMLGEPPRDARALAEWERLRDYELKLRRKELELLEREAQERRESLAPGSPWPAETFREPRSRFHYTDEPPRDVEVRTTYGNHVRSASLEPKAERAGLQQAVRSKRREGDRLIEAGGPAVRASKPNGHAAACAAPSSKLPADSKQTSQAGSQLAGSRKPDQKATKTAEKAKQQRANEPQPAVKSASAAAKDTVRAADKPVAASHAKADKWKPEAESKPKRLQAGAKNNRDSSKASEGRANRSDAAAVKVSSQLSNGKPAEEKAASRPEKRKAEAANGGEAKRRSSPAPDKMAKAGDSRKAADSKETAGSKGKSAGVERRSSGQSAGKDSKPSHKAELHQSADKTKGQKAEDSEAKGKTLQKADAGKESAQGNAGKEQDRTTSIRKPVAKASSKNRTTERPQSAQQLSSKAANATAKVTSTAKPKAEQKPETSTAGRSIAPSAEARVAHSPAAKRGEPGQLSGRAAEPTVSQRAQPPLPSPPPLPLIRQCSAAAQEATALPLTPELPMPPGPLPLPPLLVDAASSSGVQLAGPPLRLKSGVVVGSREPESGHPASDVLPATANMNGLRYDSPGTGEPRHRGRGRTTAHIDLDDRRSEWLYVDPQGKTQGPASKHQLRLWLTQLASAKDKRRLQAFCRVLVWREGLHPSSGVPLLRLLDAL